MRSISVERGYTIHSFYSLDNFAHNLTIGRFMDSLWVKFYSFVLLHVAGSLVDVLFVVLAKGSNPNLLESLW